MVNSAVLLYTMQCNIACAHCSVDSHPLRREKMSPERAADLVRGLCSIPEVQFIDVSGGEPMLHRQEVAVLATIARDHGKSMRIVSNGFWARDLPRATECLLEMQRAGVTSVGISIDEWHLAFLSPTLIENYIQACRSIGMQAYLSCVVPGPPAYPPPGTFPDAVIGLLRLYRLRPAECVDVYAWADARERLRPEAWREFDAAFAAEHVLVNWQFLTGEGRARDLDVPTLSFDETEPEPCGMAGRLPTLDNEGRLFPCCSPWVSRKEHALARVTGPEVAGAVASMRREALVELIHRFGPSVLVKALRDRGVDLPDVHSGICSQCGMMLDRVPLEVLRSIAGEVLEQKLLLECLESVGVRRIRALPGTP